MAVSEHANSRWMKLRWKISKDKFRNETTRVDFSTLGVLIVSNILRKRRATLFRSQAILTNSDDSRSILCVVVSLGYYNLQGFPHRRRSEILRLVAGSLAFSIVGCPLHTD